MRVDEILLAPVVTEKSVAMNGKYTFKVNTGATKADVASAVNEFYGVTVESVRMINTPAKFRTGRRGQATRKKAEAKKAIVTLKDGESIDYNAMK